MGAEDYIKYSNEEKLTIVQIEEIEAYEQQGETTEAKEEATACTEATKSVPENTLPAPATKADLAAAEKIADKDAEMQARLPFTTPK